MTIVIVGVFTPGIMSPFWFSFHGLVSTREAEEATVTLMTPELTQIDFGWGRFYADQQRIQVSTSQSPWVRASDLISKMLSEVLPGTTCRAVGINVSMDYPVTAEQRESLGQKLAPRDAWGNWGKRLNNADPTKPSNGLTLITMRQGSDLENPYNKYVDVSVKSSNILKPYGISIYINDHYSYMDEPDSSVNSEIAAKTLASEFEKSLERSHSIAEEIMQGVE
ncbi:hypothetical protein [Metapseudomonas furukawaii]|uniref:hypothetical protein n=1 Tax=Metapseudomonas furukawaii TaxID=1149133 RepID=UPI0010387B8B|nr:hypothetical protein [Pseudomonas furukawaii]